MMLRSMILALTALLAAPAVASDDPVELIRDTTHTLYDLVSENRAKYEENPELLRAELESILKPRTDNIYSARLVLGRHGRGLEREQIEAFSEALSGLLMDRYATGLLEFESREQVEILPLSGENTERQTRVRTRIQLDSGDRAPVDYVLRKRDGEWLVFDVIIEGISYVATFRNQISEEIRRDGFESMLERLERGDIEVDVEPENGEA